ncbi:hypothetical protein [Kordia sp.]|uniref:hypothetical protein n=1 Tax=Kordia sp. TaxID=1965332 RepID=UPI003B5CA311
MKKRNLRSLRLRKRSISNLQQQQILGANSVLTTSLNIQICLIRTLISRVVCPDPPEDDTIEAPNTK